MLNSIISMAAILLLSANSNVSNIPNIQQEKATITNITNNEIFAVTENSLDGEGWVFYCSEGSKYELNQKITVVFNTQNTDDIYDDVPFYVY